VNKQEWIALLKKVNAMPLSSKLVLGAVLVGLLAINIAPTLIFHSSGHEQSSEQQ
jgi:hypothetical protein